MNTTLVVDIGNTSTSIGLYRAGRITNERRIQTSSSSKASIISALRGLKYDSAVIASVVPRVNAVWKQTVKHRAIWVNHYVNLGVRISYPKPATIGADRLANVCGGFHKYGAPLIVVDFGTATTFDVVAAALRAAPTPAFIGGVIAPGFRMMLSYLAEKTAKLPLIEPGPVPRNIGKSTQDAMRLGAHWGYRGLVLEIIKELTRNPVLSRAKLIATGGYAKRLARGLPRRMIVDQNLTLYGLGKISELNS